MSELLINLGEFVKMIFAVIVQPNNAASAEYLTLLNFVFDTRNNINSQIYVTRYLILIPIGLFMLGGSIALLKRFLWKN